jgi:hypothetical protein
VLAAQGVGGLSRRFAGNPLALACPGGDFSIQRAGEFQGDQGAALADSGEKAGERLFRLLFQHAGFYGDAGGAQAGEAGAVYARIWVGAGDNHVGDAGLDQGVGAGWGLAGMRAGFQGDVGGGATCGFASLGQGLGFGVRPAARRCEGTANDPALPHKDTADGGVGPGGAQAAPGEGGGGAHVGGLHEGGNRTEAAQAAVPVPKRGLKPGGAMPVQTFRALDEREVCPTSVMEAEVFDAFRAIGVTDLKAMAAAQALSRRDADVTSLKSDMVLVKWMLGFVMALNVAVSLRLFLL